MITEDVNEVGLRGHGVFLGLAIKLVLQAFPDSKLMCVDDKTSNRSFDECPTCPTIGGYRPDAIVVAGQTFIIIECKSGADVLSEHSYKQYSLAEKLVTGLPDYRFFLFCFNTTYTEAEITLLLPTGLQSAGLSQVICTTEGWHND